MKNLKLFSSKLILAAVVLLTSISCANSPTDSLNKDSQKYLSFYETADGERIHWEVNFEGSEITSIYKNGKRIPDDLVSDYKSKVYRELDEMRIGGRFFSFRMPDIDIDMDELHKNMEDLKEKFKDYKLHWKEFKFDDEKLKEDMKELEEKLKDKKFEKFYYKFDDEKFEERMKKLEEYLKEHLEDFKFEFHFDEESSNNDEA